MKKIILLFVCILNAMSAMAEDAEEEKLAQFITSIDEDKLIAAVENLGPSAGGFQNTKESGPNDEDYIDPRVLRDFIESKGLIQCRQKEGALTIAGDVRARWLAAGEMLNGIKQRGFGTPTAIHRFKSEVSLYFDYVAPRSWVSTKLRFSTFDGVDGGSLTRVDMDRAFIGYDVFEDGDTDFYIEIGRSNLDYLFESKVQFSSIFDGIHLFFTTEWPCMGQYTIHGGPFIVDSYTNHYAWAVETFITNFRETGLSFKYNMVNWFRNAPTLDYGNLPNSGDVLIEDNPRYRFVVSQWLVGYEKKIDFLNCKAFFLYGAYLHNWAARGHLQTHGKKLNNAFYVGFTLGKLCKACDWSIDINYQYVQAQAVPEFDLNGIGHGNAANGLLSDAIILGLSPNAVRLFTNFKGVEFNALYAMTDALSLRSRAQYSVPINSFVGGHFKYKACEMAVIYAF